MLKTILQLRCSENEMVQEYISQLTQSKSVQKVRMIIFGLCHWML